MKKTIALVVTVTALAVPSLLANTITLTGPGGVGEWQTGVGGEFTFYSSDLASYIANYYSGAKNQAGTKPNFQTFCVEGGEEINPNGTYTAVFDTHTVASDPTALTYAAALLYSDFASGAFPSTASYDYANSGVGRKTDAALLQDAIWYYMGGIQGVTYNSLNPYMAYASSTLGALADQAAPAGYDGVWVLNLYATGPNGALINAQDQLIWAPTPDGGTTVLLLGIGLVGLVLVSRRFAVTR
jgi:hypothetical protein